MRVLRMMIIGTALATLAAPAASYAQSTGADWNGNFTFRSQSERLVDLAQAALIRRGEDGNYSRWRDRVQFDAFAFSTLRGIGGSDDDFYETDGGFISIDRSGDFWADWSVGGVTVTIR
ncbi:MAG: hypothetical protein ACTSX7_08900 [Alphaproteobacteria bacterium]